MGALVECFRSPGVGSFIHLLCGERDKGSGRAPLINPRGPARKSVLRTALTSRVPDCGRLDSTYSPVPGLVHVSVRLCPPSMASRPCHSRFGSPISAGVNTVAVRWMSNEKQSLLEPRRPDKRSRAIRHYSRHAIAGWRLRLIRPTKPEPAETAQAGSAFTRHPALSPPYQLPDGGYALSGLPNRSPLIRPGDCRGYSGAPPSPCAEGHFQPRTSGKSSPCSRT